MSDSSTDELPATQPPVTLRKRLALAYGRLDDLLEGLSDLEQRQRIAQSTIKAQSETIRTAFEVLSAIREQAAQQTASPPDSPGVAEPSQAPLHASGTSLADRIVAADRATAGRQETNITEEDLRIISSAAAGQQAEPSQGRVASKSALPAGAGEPESPAGAWRTRVFEPDKPLVFTHIPKCAGTTFNLGLAHIAREGRMRMLSIAGASSKLADRNRLDRALAGHQLELGDFDIVTGHVPFGVFRDDARAFNFMLSVRDPVARALSDMFSQPGYKQNPDSTYIELLELGGTRSPNIEYFIDNIHVRMLSDDPEFGGPCTRRMLNEAIANIEEHYALIFSAQDISFALDEICTRTNTPPFAAGAQNVTDEKPNKIPNDIIDAIRERNRLDIELLAAIQETSQAWRAQHTAYAPTARETRAQEIPGRYTTIPVDDPRTPSDWRETAADIILELDGGISIRKPWKDDPTSDDPLTTSD